MASTLGGPLQQPSLDASLGTAVEKNAANHEDTVSRTTILLHSLAFVFGFGVVFTLLGSAAGLLGRNLFEYQIMIQKVGAVLLVVLGLATMGLFRRASTFVTARTDVKTNPIASLFVGFCTAVNTLLYTERRVKDMHDVDKGWGYASSFAIGVSFSAGWVPCIGPILASILLLASDSATAAQGAGLLAIYSLGLGIPFLMTGLAFSTATNFLRKMNKHMGAVSIISGLFMLLIGYYLWTDQLIMLTAQFSFLNELVFGIEDWVTTSLGSGSASLGSASLSPTGTSPMSTAPLAFLAGIISFISPCVLPLVPAYIGYLSGTSLNHA